MSNIFNYNFSGLKSYLSNSDFWDFYISGDRSDYGSMTCDPLEDGSCAVVWYDFNNSDIYEDGIDGPIFSLNSWTGATNSGYTLNTVGLTGIDNGLVLYEKDTLPYNPNLLSALTGSTLVIPSGDPRFVMHQVSGTTEQFIYPVEHLNDQSGDYTNFCGGFYQGFYKIDGETYEVLPTRVNQAWSAEFWIKPQEICNSGTTGTTLNDLYPENKGIFFYMGTRAENKFWNTFEGADTGCTSGCTVDTGCTDTLSAWCTVPKETDIVLEGEYGVGIPLNPPIVNIKLVTNPFLIYGRASKNSHCMSCGEPSGLGNETACSYTGQTKFTVTYSQTITNNINPFLIYGRASRNSHCMSCGEPSGYGNETACSFSGFSEDQKTLDYNLDVMDNALGFRIQDDGSIGYRSMTVTGSCSGETYSSGVTINEGYSVSGMVAPDEWNYVVIRFVTNYLDDCDLKTAKPRKGKLMFYVNGKLKYVVNEFDEFIARRLNDNKLKQVAVPFNMSLGGGSQGLIDSQTFDGLDMDDRGLPIEKNFGGSFIGGISQFRFNICDLSYCQIQNNYQDSLNRYE